MSLNPKNTIIKILCLYLGTSAIFLCIGFYYLNMKGTENIFFLHMANLRDISFEFHDTMRKYGRDTQGAIDELVASTNMPFAIYDRNNNLIFSNLLRLPTPQEQNKGIFRIRDKVIVNPDIIPHHKDRKPMRKPPYSIFLEDNNVDSTIIIMRLQLLATFVLVFLLMSVVAYILVKLFLKPINQHIKFLDTFIKDTTHEINTPLSIILMSIETLNKTNFSKEDEKKIERIKLASLQINQIYNTLVTYNFPQSISDKHERFSLERMLKERLEFFHPFLAQKKITLQSDICAVEFVGNKEKWIIVFDNLLSNAIKYNHKGGSIYVELKEHEFILKDSGCGIDNDNLDKIYERYSRFDEGCGGFGIGLSLVKKICDEYKIRIDVISTKQGSTFHLTW